MATTFNYSIQNDFPNQAVDASVLSVEIEDSTITATLEGINVNGDDCEIMFDTDLTAGEETTLNNIVANHQGIPFNQGTQRVNAIAAQDNSTNTWQTAVTLNADPVGVDQYTLSFYCELRTTGGNNNSQAQYQILLDGSDVAQGGVEGKTFFDSRSGGLLINTSRGTSPVIEIQWRQNAGASTTAQIRRCRLAIIPFLESED
jgi:hypothetical protein